MQVWFPLKDNPSIGINHFLRYTPLLSVNSVLSVPKRVPRFPTDVNYITVNCAEFKKKKLQGVFGFGCIYLLGKGQKWYFFTLC